MQSLKKEFETLSHGVSRYGENISLTTDEYDRYKQIVQTIVDISPALSEGYSIENGYLADKNELIERAIELQEQQYKSELRQMTTTEKLSEVIKGYAASYDKLKNSDILTTDTDLSNNMWGMFRVNDRDVTPEFAGNSGDNKSRYLSEQIMKALGVTDIGKELENTPTSTAITNGAISGTTMQTRYLTILERLRPLLTIRKLASSLSLILRLLSKRQRTLLSVMVRHEMGLKRPIRMLLTS